ncbi:hypothetical protein FRB91_007886 [Serendipita sp. 411]|nr:hypothetical protein FRC19_007566 [Serendipita sp. 401]KAG8837894.1 hypothetical protein FRB91_007886 [Serendipita sp. 411]KAG9020600.1 hypothetical protein FS842_007183 [Serendipita sp. 407]
MPGTKWVGEYRKTTQIVMLPRLVRLKLKGSWVELLQVYAPVLEYLVLRIIDNGENIVMAVRYLLHTPLRPRRLEITSDENGVVLEQLLRGPFVDEVELRVNAQQRWVVEGHLSALLSGSTGQPPLYPKMEYLMVTMCWAYQPLDKAKFVGDLLEAINQRVGTSKVLS